MVVSRVADVLGLYPKGYDDTVYYNVDAITNILSFKKMAKVYRITYNSSRCIESLMDWSIYASLCIRVDCMC
jgi:hypothetical protein